MDVLVVGSPSARREPAFVSEEACREIVQVKLAVGGVIENLLVLVKVVTIGRVLGGVPQGKSCCSTVVIARAATGVESRETGRPSDFVSCTIVKKRHHHVLVNVFGCVDERICIGGVVNAVACSDVCKCGNEHTCGIGADTREYDTVRSAFGFGLCVLAFRQIPILVVFFVNAHGMVHVILGDESVCLGGFVEFQNIVCTDFRFVENVRNTVRKDCICIRMSVTVFCLVGVGEIDHRKHIGGIAKRFRNLEVVTAVVPSACQVVADFGTVFQVARLVEV